MDLVKEIFRKAKKNIEINKNYYPNEDCSDLAKSFIRTITSEYRIVTWQDMFKLLKLTVNPEISSLENLENFLSKYKTNILNNE